MYEDFLKQFSSNPAAVAYANWQLAQAYQGTGDLPKALDYGDKALASAPHSLDILVSQASIAQQMKNNAKLLDYSVRGGEVYNSIGKDQAGRHERSGFCHPDGRAEECGQEFLRISRGRRFQCDRRRNQRQGAHERHRSLHAGISQLRALTNRSRPTP